jgi:hypothetical protein
MVCGVLVNISQNGPTPFALIWGVTHAHRRRQYQPSGEASGVVFPIQNLCRGTKQMRR